MRFAWCWLGVLMTGPGISAGWAADLPWHGNSLIHWATAAEGEEILTREDRFLQAVGPFDRQGRVGTADQVSPAKFQEFLRSHVRPWDPAEELQLRGVLTRLLPRLAELHLPFPPVVSLVKTTGGEEGGAAYCRQAAVVLPQAKLRSEGDALERLLAHELFHVLTAHHRAFRERCYQVIGFQLVPPISLPPSLVDQRITNPDGPLVDAVIAVQIDGTPQYVAPVLFASAEKYDPQRGGPFFRYLTFRLLVVEQTGGMWRPRLRADQPWLLIPSDVPDYGRQIGRNTGYIIHPDEVLADNFVHLVFGKQELPNPEIVDRLREACRSSDLARENRAP